MDFNELFAAMMGFGLSDGDNAQYEEIQKLHQLLTQAEIPHDFFERTPSGYQITYYGSNENPKAKPGVISGPGVGTVCSAIETPFSYGSAEDKIEISGLLTEEELARDSVKGYLTAEEVFQRIKKHWTASKKT